MSKLTIDDYVLQLLEELNMEDIKPEEVDNVIKKIDATVKIATVSIENEKAKAQNKEAENRRLEIETKRGMIIAQITGELPGSFKENNIALIGVNNAEE